MKRGFTTRQMALIGVMAAVVFVATNLRIPIPLPVGKTMIHMGNVACLLSAFLLGPIGGGLAAGIGSGLFDLMSEYAVYAPFTLVFKFLLAFVCGHIAYSGGRNAKRLGVNILAGIAGSVTYIVLHLTRTMLENAWFLNVAWDVNLLAIGQNTIVSLINAVFAVIIAVPLGMAVNRALKNIL